VFASVEQRVSMVRAVNSGVSAFIDPNGRVIEKTYAVDPHFHPHPATSNLATLPLLEGGHTVFAKVGDLFAYMCALCIVFFVARSVSWRDAASPRTQANFDSSPRANVLAVSDQPAKILIC